MKGAKSKPNRAITNQYTAPDPRQSLFFANYFDVKSKTFSNALQSALAAGYAQEYAENITHLMPEWLSERIGQMDMLRRAEKNLSEVLDMSPKVQAMGAFGPIFEKTTETYIKKYKNGRKVKKTRVVQGKPIMVTNAKLLQIKTDTSKFIAERVGRIKYGREPAEKTPPQAVTAVQVNFNEDRERFT